MGIFADSIYQTGKKTITGNYETREVKIDGETLSPAKSLKVVNHSPDGFNWGYAGSGPAQLALAILLEFVDEEFAAEHYQAFKYDVVAKWPKEDFRYPVTSLADWVRTREGG